MSISITNKTSAKIVNHFHSSLTLDSLFIESNTLVTESLIEISPSYDSFK